MSTNDTDDQMYFERDGATIRVEKTNDPGALIGTLEALGYEKIDRDRYLKLQNKAQRAG